MSWRPAYIHNGQWPRGLYAAEVIDHAWFFCALTLISFPTKPMPSSTAQPLQEGPASSASSAQRCELAEIVQFHCQLQHQRILCQPVERVFRLCPRRPAVEVTHLVDYTPAGEPFLPDHLM